MNIVVLCVTVELGRESSTVRVKPSSVPDERRRSREMPFLPPTLLPALLRPFYYIQVKSEQEALNLLYGGELMRTTAQHNLNKKSNRSHSIFTVYVTQRARSGVSEKVPLFGV